MRCRQIRNVHPVENAQDVQLAFRADICVIGQDGQLYLHYTTRSGELEFLFNKSIDACQILSRFCERRYANIVQ